MTFFWLFMLIVMCISCVSTAKIHCNMHVKFAISFAHSWVFFRFVHASELTAWRKMFSLLSLQRDMIRSRWLINTFVILWRICLMIFFCIFFTSSLSAIFIMILHLLRSDDDFSLKCCFFIDNSSLVTFAYDMIFNEKRVFLCICNCLLSSWTDALSFCTFFVMNAFWVMWCFSFDSSWRWHINFNAIFYWKCVAYVACNIHKTWSLCWFFP